MQSEFSLQSVSPGVQFRAWLNGRQTVTWHARIAGWGFTRNARIKSCANAINGENFLKVGANDYVRRSMRRLAFPAKTPLKIDRVLDE